MHPRETFSLSSINHPLVEAFRNDPSNADVEVSPWFPGRICARVEPSCTHICLMAKPRHTFQSDRVHCHFTFDSQTAMDEVNAIRAMSTYINERTVPSDSVECMATFNDWRYIRADRSLVEMKLDAPLLTSSSAYHSPSIHSRTLHGKDADEEGNSSSSIHMEEEKMLAASTGSIATTVFNADCLGLVLANCYWATEPHNGAHRARRVSSFQLTRLLIPRMSRFMGSIEDSLSDAASAIIDPPVYLHEFIVASHARILRGITVDMTTLAVSHIDGNMLNNSTENLKPRSVVHPFSGGSSTATTATSSSSPPVSKMDSMQSGYDSSSSSSGVTSSPSRSAGKPRKRARRTSLRSDNSSGVPGLSISKDGNRFFVKVKSEHQGEIRKSFSVYGARRLYSPVQATAAATMLDPSASLSSMMTVDTQAEEKIQEMRIERLQDAAAFLVDVEDR